jgi:ribulose 1,5-bisphosphate carboxylase large subunit-like protein
MTDQNFAPFDPWTATFQDAEALQKKGTGSRGPLFQQVAAQTVLAMRARIEANDGLAVLEAVATCALHDLVMPDWLAREYLRRWRLVTHASMASWDDAFGAPWPKGIKRSHLARKRQRDLAKHIVFNAVTQFVMMHPDSPLDPEWDRIACEAGVSKSLAQDLYYKQPSFPGMSAADIRKSMGWPARVPAKKDSNRVPTKSRKLAGRQSKR